MKLTTDVVRCDGGGGEIPGGDFRAVLDTDALDEVQVERFDGDWREVGQVSVEHHHGRTQLFNLPSSRGAPPGRRFSDRLLNLLETRLGRAIRAGAG